VVARANLVFIRDSFRPNGGTNSGIFIMFDLFCQLCGFFDFIRVFEELPENRPGPPRGRP
jgi:hypothetical protein